MNTENEKNPIENRKEMADEAVDQVTGGALGITLNNDGTYTMTCRFQPGTNPTIDTGVAAPAVDAGVAATANAATAPADTSTMGIRTPKKFVVNK